MAREVQRNSFLQGSLYSSLAGLIWIYSTLGDSKLLEWLKDADFGLFGATWWPQASMERLRIVTYISIWVCPLTVFVANGEIADRMTMFSCSSGRPPTVSTDN